MASIFELRGDVREIDHGEERVAEPSRSGPPETTTHHTFDQTDLFWPDEVLEV